MCSGNEIYVILMVEFVNNVSTKEISSTSRADTPSADVIGVAPHKVTHGSIVRHFLLTVEATDFIQGVDGGRKTSMNTKDFVVNDSCEGEIVENLGAVSPYVYRTILS